MNQATVPCKWCNKPTTYLGTRECDFCHTLEMAIHRDPAMARRMLAELEPKAIIGDLPSTDIVYYMVAYGDLDSGFTFYGPFEEEQAKAFRATLPKGNAEVHPLAEAVVFNTRHGFHTLTKRGYVVKPVEPWEKMTSDDWIHASNGMREHGGHFAGYLARAFQHADLGNQKPIKANYGRLFFGFLSIKRQLELKA